MHKKTESLKQYARLIYQRTRKIGCQIIRKLKPMLETLRRYSVLLYQWLRDQLHTILRFCRAHWPGIRDRLQQYALLMRLDKPIGILLLLWPTLWALWIAAEGVPRTDVLLVFLLGVVLMRSAGCVLNDIADRRIDPFVERTKNRPIARGTVTAAEALMVALCLIFFAFLLVLTMNMLTIQLAFVAVLLAGIYPFMKRYTYLPQFFLGLAFGWSIPMAFAAQTGSVPQIAWLLLIANILWSVVYDTMYAIADREDDLKIGVKSTAILFDDADRLIIARIQLLVLITLITVGHQAKLDMVFFYGVGVAACLFIYQLWLIKNREPDRCIQAFKNNNWFGITIFTSLFLNYI